MLDEYEELSNVMPKTLKYWPTYYTLDEIKDFFRFPMLYDGEHIEIQKKTEPKKFGGDIILGKNTVGNKCTFKFTKKTCICMWVTQLVKQILCFIYVIHYGNVMFHF